jgi:hypothetical protein
MMRRLQRSCWLAFALLGSSCDDANSPPDDLGRACERVTNCGEGATRAELRECEQRLTDEYDDAASYGCASAYSDWVSCLATATQVCDRIVLDSSAQAKRATPPMQQSCHEADQALQRCRGEHGRDECVVIGNVGGAGGAGPSGCVISCALFSATCQPGTDGSQGCACDTGDKIGASFSTDSCNNLERVARYSCQ